MRPPLPEIARIVSDARMATADLAACRALLRQGSKSFHAASLLLPQRVATRAVALYAFCRLADDIIDDGAGGAAAVEALRERVARLCAGQPADHPVDRALAAVVRQTGLPQALLDALVEGFAWDAEGRQYQTLADVEAYAARVAGCVGVMMTVLMGRRQPDVLARAADLGVAMQLTNIARDVGEDARNGRLYLPRDWMADEGVDAADFLAEPLFSPGLARVVSRLLDHADMLYARAEAGIAGLPPDCRAAIRSASRIYSEIGRMVRVRNCDSVSARAATSLGRKITLVAGAFGPGRADARDLAAPPLPGNLFLVHAAAVAEAAPVAAGIWHMPETPNFAARARAVLSMVERLEQADRLAMQRLSPSRRA